MNPIVGTGNPASTSSLCTTAPTSTSAAGAPWPLVVQLLGLAETRGVIAAAHQREHTTPAAQGQGDRADQQDRVYVVNANEVVQDTTMITSTLLLDSVPVVIIFDSDSTHTFMTHTFIPRIGVRLEDLGSDLDVTTPTREVLTIGLCVRGVVAIQRNVLFTDFTAIDVRV